MTSEIVIINQQGIALAADSAVTIGRKRVWKHASKLFSAGPNNDIAIMIYNTGDFIGIPWEVIVKEHRRGVSHISFSSVADYVNSFVAFIKSEKISNESLEVLSFASIIVDTLEDIKSNIQYNSKQEFIRSLDAEIIKQTDDLQNCPELQCSIKLSQFMEVFKPILKDLAEDAFGYNINRKTLNSIGGLVFEHIRRQSLSEFHTGIVIAGYGRDELFPNVHHLTVDGKCLGLTRVWRAGKTFDLNGDDAGGSALLPFAQTDMAYLFMEGISRRYPIFLQGIVESVLNGKSKDLIDRFVKDPDEKIVETELQRRDNRKIVEELIKEFANFRKNDFVDPVLETISALPKEEMAFMAKAMVEITALRRKFASAVESVGGDIDVALITKSDGFIWMSRKHYFDVDFNVDFLDRRQILKGGRREEVIDPQGSDNKVAKRAVAGEPTGASAEPLTRAARRRGRQPSDGSGKA